MEQIVRGEITVKIREGEGVVQTGLHAPSGNRAVEERSYGLYRRLRPFIEAMNIHAQDSLVPAPPPPSAPPPKGKGGRR